MTYAEFKRAWKACTETQRAFYRHKANWEHMTLWAVMEGWPTTDAEARVAFGLARLKPHLRKRKS